MECSVRKVSERIAKKMHEHNYHCHPLHLDNKYKVLRETIQIRGSWNGSTKKDYYQWNSDQNIVPTVLVTTQGVKNFEVDYGSYASQPINSRESQDEEVQKLI